MHALVDEFVSVGNLQAAWVLRPNLDRTVGGPNERYVISIFASQTHQHVVKDKPRPTQKNDKRQPPGNPLQPTPTFWGVVLDGFELQGVGGGHFQVRSGARHGAVPIPNRMLRESAYYIT